MIWADVSFNIFKVIYFNNIYMSTLLLILKRTALMCESATCFVGSKLGARDARPPGVEILSYSCSFRRKNL